MDLQHLPSILTFVGMMITIAGNIAISILTQRTQNRAQGRTADAEFRDDLLALVERYEEQLKNRDAAIEKKDTQINNLQATIAKLIEENTSLRIEKRELEGKVRELENELVKFERKVYFIRDPQQQ